MTPNQQEVAQVTLNVPGKSQTKLGCCILTGKNFGLGSKISSTKNSHDRFKQVLGRSFAPDPFSLLTRETERHIIYIHND